MSSTRFATDTELNFEDLLTQACETGLTLFDLPDHLAPEVSDLAKKLSDPDSSYASEVVEATAPNVFRSLITPINDIVMAKFVTFASVHLAKDTATVTPTLHTDDVIRNGVSILVPSEGPPAKLYHAESALRFPADDLEYVTYSVGKAVLIRQQLGVLDGVGNTTKLPARFHGGWCLDGPRKVITIDFHTDDSITALQAQTE